MTLDTPPPIHASLRDRLRHDSAGQHHALDSQMSLFDLCDPDGLAGFLRANERGFAALAVAGDPAAAGTALAADLTRRIREDLARLGMPPLPAAPRQPALSPLAVDYVVLGSRLGSAVLKRRWARATDPRVAGAAAYFSAPPQVRAWQAFCEKTGSLPSTGTIADRATDDTCRILTLFYRTRHSEFPASSPATSHEAGPFS